MISGFLGPDGGRIHYEATGEGSPVVLIPGFTLDTRMWDDQAEAFAARHRVIRYDLRGAGRSDPPQGPYRHEEDLLALLDHLGIGQAHLIGLSLGGAIAIDFALAYPERVLSLVPVAVSAVGGYPWPAEIDEWFARIGPKAKAGDIEEAKELWLSTGWFAPAMRDPAVAAKLRRIAEGYSGWHFANRNPVERISPPANDRLGEIAAPTLIVTGGLDLPYYNLPLAERLASAIPGARSVLIEDAGHMVNMEAPERFNAAALDFLAEIDRSAAQTPS